MPLFRVYKDFDSHGCSDEQFKIGSLHRVDFDEDGNEEEEVEITADMDRFFTDTEALKVYLSELVQLDIEEIQIEYTNYDGGE